MACTRESSTVLVPISQTSGSINSVPGTELVTRGMQFSHLTRITAKALIAD